MTLSKLIKHYFAEDQSRVADGDSNADASFAATDGRDNAVVDTPAPEHVTTVEPEEVVNEGPNLEAWDAI
jgi:hypothetical protein